MELVTRPSISRKERYQIKVAHIMYPGKECAKLRNQQYRQLRASLFVNNRQDRAKGTGFSQAHAESGNSIRRETLPSEPPVPQAVDTNGSSPMLQQQF